MGKRETMQALSYIVIFGLLTVLTSAEYPQPCDDDIYCYGEILHTVQLAVPFEDRKTYVDLPLKQSRQNVKLNFASMMANTSNNPSVEDVKGFLKFNFGERGEELSVWQPTDWISNPGFLLNIKDNLLRQFGSELNALWKELGKVIHEDVKLEQDKHSLVYLPNPVILPGGRFLELYYWDTYWIIRGLIHCEMLDSVKGMLQDFLILLDKYGYVPNGNRIYYSRTQPPFLIQMFKDYFDASQDEKFLLESLPLLEKEFQFWVTNRSVVVNSNDGSNHTLFRYNNEVTGPRPESYAREYIMAETLETPQLKDEFYMNMKSAAESGWDFSTRWYPICTPENSSLLATRASQVVPVDLNAIMCKNAKTLAAFHAKFGNNESSRIFETVANEIEEAIDVILWDNITGVWLDYDLKDKKLRNNFYPSNIFPLWAGIGTNDTNRIARIVDYLHDSKALIWDGGIPTSLLESSQQWDYPNAWPPLQHLFVESLENSGYLPAKQIAFDTAQKWVANNYLTYTRYNNTMFEKYRADMPGEPGGGGLYDVVVGFGWTNGVIIDFLQRYGDQLSAMFSNVSNLI